MKQTLGPGLTIALGVFLAALLLQWASLQYLSTLSKEQFNTETRKLKTQIAQDLTNQLATAINSEDDLAALIVLKSARSTHAQLYKAEVFEANGKITMHTDAGMMNKLTKPYKGPRPISPELSRAQIDGRPLSVVLVPMPDDDELYFRAFFDDTRLTQARRSYVVRFYLLIICTSLLLGLLALYRVSRFELLDPKQRADVKEQLKTDIKHTQRVAELLLSEMRHAALAVDRNNTILAANSLALELLNCRAEELVSMHIMQAPLPKSLQEFYQQAIKNPNQVSEEKLSLTGKDPSLPIKLTCAPASADWELAVVSIA
jgi:PAS domain-containing protein